MDKDINKIINDIPNIDTNQKFHIDLAGELFKNKEISFNYTKGDNEDKTNDCIKIVLNNSLTLWFFKKDNEWIYDGWEMGDYKNYWIKDLL